MESEKEMTAVDGIYMSKMSAAGVKAWKTRKMRKELINRFKKIENDINEIKKILEEEK